jgi:hypothetical protein
VLQAADRGRRPLDRVPHVPPHLRFPLFAAGRNVSCRLGHHSPGLTLDTYIRLLDDGVGGGRDPGMQQD